MINATQFPFGRKKGVHPRIQGVLTLIDTFKNDLAGFSSEERKKGNLTVYISLPTGVSFLFRVCHISKHSSAFHGRFPSSLLFSLLLCSQTSWRFMSKAFRLRSICHLKCSKILGIDRFRWRVGGCSFSYSYTFPGGLNIFKMRFKIKFKREVRAFQVSTQRGAPQLHNGYSSCTETHWDVYTWSDQFCVCVCFYNKVYFKRKYMAYLLTASFLDFLSI